MKLKFLGVRGSRPTHKVDLLGFGGNSTCLEFYTGYDDRYLFLDGGSGLVHRGRSLKESHKKYYFVITHTHWDHVLGFPLFEPLYDTTNQFIIYASTWSCETMKNLFYGPRSALHSPIPINRARASVSFRPIDPGDSFTVFKDVSADCFQLNHQGITLGYRIRQGGYDAAVITDNAPIGGGNYLGSGMKAKAQPDPKRFESDFDEQLIKFLQGCHTVVFDTHFTEENLKVDWGHSTPERALDFCIKAGVKRLILFHHAPEDMDTQVRKKVNGISDLAESHGIEVFAAREGDEWEPI